MNSRIVYQTTADGIYVGETFADESPLEPGVFLIPGLCVEEKPPAISSGEVAIWTGNSWEVADISVEESAAHDAEEVSSKPLSEEDRAIYFIAGVRLHLDNSAQAFGYDSMQSAVTYAEEPAVPKFQLEGKSFRAWRSVVWDFTHSQLARLMKDTREEDEVLVDFIKELPPFVVLAEPSAEDSPVDSPVEEQVEEPTVPVSDTPLAN
jgi:hypothetical protein